MSDEKQKALGLFIAGFVVMLVGGVSAFIDFEALRLPPSALLFLGGGVALAGAVWFAVQMVQRK